MVSVFFALRNICIIPLSQVTFVNARENSTVSEAFCCPKEFVSAYHGKGQAQASPFSFEMASESRNVIKDKTGLDVAHFDRGLPSRTNF